jgi:hypothetical protein
MKKLIFISRECYLFSPPLLLEFEFFPVLKFLFLQS